MIETLTFHKDGQDPGLYPPETIEAELLASVDASEDWKQRWTELHLWRECSGQRRYVVEIIGVSNVEGEEDRVAYRVANTADGVINQLRRRGALSHLARKLLREASEADETVREMFDRFLGAETAS